MLSGLGVGSTLMKMDRLPASTTIPETHSLFIDANKR